MSEKNNKAVNQDQAKTPDEITLTIKMKRTDTGTQISVHGPIHDEILCYGMLKKAEQVVAQYQVDQKLEALRKPSNIIMPEQFNKGIPV